MFLRSNIKHLFYSHPTYRLGLPSHRSLRKAAPFLYLFALYAPTRYTHRWVHLVGTLCMSYQKNAIFAPTVGAVRGCSSWVQSARTVLTCSLRMHSHSLLENLYSVALQQAINISNRHFFIDSKNNNGIPLILGIQNSVARHL